MRNLKIRDIFGVKGLNKRVYLVMKGKTPIYVGMANKQCVADRMARHIGDVFAKQKGSKFSNYLFENHPKYFTWHVKIFTPNEIKSKTKKQFSCVPCAEKALYDHFKVNGFTPICNVGRPGGKCECNT